MAKYALRDTDGQTHTRFKAYCKARGLKMQDVIARVLDRAMDLEVALITEEEFNFVATEVDATNGGLVGLAVNSHYTQTGKIPAFFAERKK